MASVFMCGVEDVLFSGSRFVWTVTVAALRRWYAARLRACRQALRAWCGLRDVYQVKKKNIYLYLAHRAGFSLEQHLGTWPGVRSFRAGCSVRTPGWGEEHRGGAQRILNLPLSSSRWCFQSAEFRVWGRCFPCRMCFISQSIYRCFGCPPHVTPLGAPLAAVTIPAPGIWGAPLLLCTLLPWETLAGAFSAAFVSLNSGSL